MNKALVTALAAIIVIPLVVIGGVFIFKDKIVSNAIEEGFKEITGLEVSASGIEVLKNGAEVHVGSITIANAPDFFEPTLAVISNVQMKCDPKRYMMRQGLFCSYISANLDEVYLDRTADGRINLRELQALKRDELSQPSPSEKKGVGYQIERLEIKYGVVNLTEATPNSTRNSKEELGTRTEVYGYLSDPRTLIHIPAVKLIASLNRGSMGIPRATIQQHIIDSTGKK